MTRGDLAIDAVLVVSAVGGERGERATHLIEQGTDLRSIVDVAGGQNCRGDLAGVGVHGNMRLAPRPPCLRAVLLKQPLARAQSFSPVLSTRRCTGPASDRGRNTSSVSARRLSVVWSGTARSRPSKAMIEPMSPSVWRSAKRNTDRSVSAVAIARPEQRGWPPRVVRGSAFHVATAASVNQTVRLPRCRRAAS